jgi:hypothetical protein
MFRFLTRTKRRRAGLILALAYLVCVIAPPLALAFADGTRAAHCLTHEHHATAPVHVHADGSADHHGTPAPAPSEVDHDDKSAPVQCCGLFCVTAAVADDADEPLGVALRGHAIPPTLEAAPGGTGPFRIDRPPNSLLSL